MNADSNTGDRPERKRHETIGGVLASALNMEDQISNGVYADYMDPKSWPAQLDREIFQEIRTHLTTLVEDTKKHRKILQALVAKYGQDRESE